MDTIWAELLEGLTLLAKGGYPGHFPTHCESGTLSVLADPSKFSQDELARLSELGFHADPSGEGFYSFRFGSA